MEVMEKGEMSKCLVAPLLPGKALDVRDGRSWGAAGGQASRAPTSIVMQSGKGIHTFECHCHFSVENTMFEWNVSTDKLSMQFSHDQSKKYTCLKSYKVSKRMHKEMEGM